MADVHVQRVLAAESRAALLEALGGADHPLSVEEAAAVLGLHPSTTRFHLDLLVSAGLVERSSEKRSSAGRRRIRYSVRAAGPEVGQPAAAGSGDAEGYRRLASVLADQLSGTDDPARAAREAGRRWNAADDFVLDTGPLDAGSAIDAVTGLMDRLGFAPDVPARHDEIVLRRCPFEEVARENRAVICNVHAGLLERTFEHLGGTVEVSGLEPFASDDPLRCVVRLRKAAARQADAAPAVDAEVDVGVTAVATRRRRSSQTDRGRAHA